MRIGLASILDSYIVDYTLIPNIISKIIALGENNLGKKGCNN